jgi:plastocyanin
VGDSVRWAFSHRVVHTVTFLPPGQSRPTLETPDPAHPYTGFADAAGVPFWFNGQPSLLIPPDHAFPQGGSSTDGKTYKNSGLSAPAFKPYKLKFTKTGTFRYLCLVHPGMQGSVKVLPKNRAVPPPARTPPPGSPSTSRPSRARSSWPSSPRLRTPSSPGTTAARSPGSASSPAR